jgi:predicted molibdopterin-dependent oxidoreductase YjgC
MLNGQSISVAASVTVAAALANTRKKGWRQSPSGEARTPFCGMGACFECRVKIDGVVQRSCQRLVREGMEIECHV